MITVIFYFSEFKIPSILEKKRFLCCRIYLINLYYFSAMTSGVTTPIQQDESGATDAANTSQAQQQPSYSNSSYFGTNGTEAQGSASPNNGATSNSSSLNQYSPYGRAMSQYMQESGYHYYGSPGTQPGCTTSTGGADSPTATAAALAAYYVSFF